ncbi:hypothetical protein B566_EDAN018850 [Ephemera danica]|nr:hypothetical protein B566_EDAN018850 [Ephemera danica]
MSGFSESALIGRLPPFPYWPPDRIEENTRLLQQELHGRSPAGGIEVKVMRKDGTVFDSRMYVSPLIDPRGQQTGWMTSMTNITEAKRIRDQLSASHERFTTVLEGLEASVSVLSVPQHEVLFANRSYRLWFGADGSGHTLLSGGGVPEVFTPDSEDLEDGLSGLPTQDLADSAVSPREVFVAGLQKWFDVRSRYLQWTDGRLAQMIIATDITTRLRAEQQAAQQAEKAQVTSRLVTMGEMASSVAHELNQPLTAITNYCNGMDVDGFSTLSAGELMTGLPGLRPATPLGCMALLESTGVNLRGKHAVVIGRSNTVGKPMALLLLQANATVTVCHSATPDLAAHVRLADIIIAAVGRRNTVTADMVKPGAIVIDVGTNRKEDGKLCGDVDFAAVRERAAWISPVPGGVGPMTITMLLSNTLQAAEA